MRIISFFTFVSLFIVSFAWGQETAYNQKCTGIVRGEAAEFIFPLPNKQTWKWNMKETVDNYQEYTWEISLAGAESSCKYNFGIYLFKFPNSKEVTGNISELLSDAQTSVWDESLSVRQALIVQSTVQDQKLILKVSDKKTFSELFSQKPTIAHCRVSTPYEDINFVGETQLEFRK
jgi:hypothetical protein